MQTPYEILGVDHNADDQQIHAAYLEKVRRYPPEQNQELFLKIKESYEMLQTKEKRIEYRLFHLWDALWETAFIPINKQAERQKLSSEKMFSLLKKK